MKRFVIAVLLLSGCATTGAGFLGVNGRFGPIAVSADGKSAVTVESKAVEGVPPNCVKPISVLFEAPKWSTQCAGNVPVPPAADGTCK